MFETARDHVFTLYPYLPPVMRSARGCFVEDEQGRRWLDLASGQLSAILGHSPPRILAAAAEQAARATHLGNRFLSRVVIEACAEIASICPSGLDRVVLCSTGSEANELALRIARAATGRSEVVGLRGGYYGATHELLSLSEYAGTIKGVGQRSPNLHKLPSPDCASCPHQAQRADRHQHQPRSQDQDQDQGQACRFRCLEEGARQLLEDSSSGIAAFIVEPVLGSGGILVPPRGYFRALRSLCDQHGALLIADEAQTGLGRTGHWLGLDHFDTVADIYVLSKGLGAGFPVAAVVTRADIEARCLVAPLATVSSHAFDPFGAAIARETIRTIREEGLVEAARRKGEQLRAQLGELGRHSPLLGEVRGCGLMIGFDVLGEGGLRDPLASLALEAECLDHGLIVGYSALSGVIRLLPPLTITESEIEMAVARLESALAALQEGGPSIERYLPADRASRTLAMSFLQRLGGADATTAAQ